MREKIVLETQIPAGSQRIRLLFYGRFSYCQPYGVLKPADKERAATDISEKFLSECMHKIPNPRDRIQVQ